MTDPSNAQDGLSSSQQEALDQYMQLTNQDANAAIPLLQRSEWNVQIAISKFFDGETADPLAEAVAEQNAPAPSVRFENLHESLHESPLSSSARRPRPSGPAPAPRIVPQQPGTAHRPSFLLSLLFTPFNISYRVATLGFRIALYFLSFLPRSLQPRLLTRAVSGFRSTSGRRMLLPPDTASRFKREFEEEYGPNDLPWFEGGFAQAQDLAKKELKFLLFVLVSPEHDDTEPFMRETLLSPQVVSFINDPANEIILWGGNVLDSEAYQISAEYNCTKFPFSGLVCLTPKQGSTRMGTIKRIVGPIPPSKYVSELRSAIEKYAAELIAAKSERMERDAARNIREEQDSAYERSLAQDRERARQRREEAAAVAEAERRAVREAEESARRAELKEKWRLWRAGRIEAEPEVGTKGTVRIALMLPERLGGQRIVRRFKGEAPMEELYAFAECHNVPAEETEGAAEPEGYVHEYDFAIASVMPRKVYEASGEAMRDVVGSSGNLIVEDLE